MLNDPRSHGLWEKTAPTAAATPGLTGETSADVVIVGGGFTGISTALHLAERGVKAVVLEAHEVGFGGAGRNVGLINAGMWVMPDDLPGALGAVHGERLLDVLGNAPKLVMEIIEKFAIDCELEKNGTLHCAVGDDGLKEIEDRCEQWGRRGAPVSILSAEETAKRIGTSAYRGSLLDMRAGTLQPLAYVRGLARAALSAGAVIHGSSPVIATERRGSKWLVKTENGAVTADWIVVATDAYSTGPWRQVRLEQIHLPYFNFATTPLTHNQLAEVLPGREGCWDTKEILSSFRMDRAGRLVFGSVGALRNTGAVIHKNWSRRALKKLFPMLGNVEFECEWHGKIGMTTNALPRFHKFADNVVGFSGYNGRGIAPGTVFGKILSQHILGDLTEADLPLPLTDPEEPSLRPLKEAWYEAGAQVAHFAQDRI